LNRSSTSVLATFPLNIVLTLMAAMVSYYLVERPCLRLRPRLEARWLEPAAPIAEARIEQVSGI